MLRSGWITSGPQVAQFEKDFAAYTGTPNAVAVCSATGGLDLVIQALDLKPGDRVVRRPVFEPHGEPHETAQEFVISSIQSNSRVFFKGGHGQSAWPTQLEKVDIQGSHPAHPADGVGR